MAMCLLSTKPLPTPIVTCHVLFCCGHTICFEGSVIDIANSRETQLKYKHIYRENAFYMTSVMPPACWSSFWKSNFKEQLGCRFDIMDNIYIFVFWHMQLYMSWYIRSFFGFTFLNILYFSSTPVLTSSIDVVFILSISNLAPILLWPKQNLNILQTFENEFSW